MINIKLFNKNVLISNKMWYINCFDPTSCKLGYNYLFSRINYVYDGWSLTSNGSSAYLPYSTVSASWFQSVYTKSFSQQTVAGEVNLYGICG